MKTIRKSQKGNRFCSDYIEYDKATLKASELLWSEKQMIIGFYITFAINSGLRVSDILSRKHSEMSNIKPGGYLEVVEHKTKKLRKIQVNNKICEAYCYLCTKLLETGKYNPDGFIFTSQKGSVYAIESINTLLKQAFAGVVKNVSSHSLRKSFGRAIYDNNQQSEHALILLSELFNHSSMAITRRYLGIRQEEIGSLYMNL